MAFEIIKGIVEAERQAEEMKAKAIVDAGAIHAATLKKCDEITAEVSQKAKRTEKTMIAEAIESCQSRKDEILDEAKTRGQEIREIAAKQKERAVLAVMGKVVGMDGDR